MQDVLKILAGARRMHPECITAAMLERAKTMAERNGTIPDNSKVQDSVAIISLERANGGGGGDTGDTDSPLSSGGKELAAARRWEEGAAAAAGGTAKGTLRSTAAGTWPAGSRHFKADEDANASEFKLQSWRSRHEPGSSGYNHITLNGHNRWKAQVSS